MATLGTNFFSSRRHTRVASTDDSDSRKQRLHILPGMKESEDSFSSTKIVTMVTIVIMPIRC